jgi:hypothetical protein
MIKKCFDSLQSLKTLKKRIEEEHLSLHISWLTTPSRFLNSQNGTTILRLTSDQCRNSGVIGGKFLERRVVQKPGGENYTASDFVIGKVCQIFNHRFLIMSADDFTLNYTEANPEQFPVADIFAIQKKVAQAMNSEVGSRNMLETFQKFDKDNNKYLSVAEFRQILLNQRLELQEHEILTIVRRFDLDGDGCISYEEFCRACTL